MMSVITACIAIIVIVIILSLTTSVIMFIFQQIKKSLWKSTVALLLTLFIIGTVSKYKKVETEQPQQAITLAQAQQVAIPKNQPSITCTQTQKVNNPPTTTLHRRIEIHVYGDYNVTGIDDNIYRTMDTTPNAPLIEKNISTGSGGGTIFVKIDWKESMPNPPEIKSTVDEIIDMSQNVDSAQRERIEKVLSKMRRNPEREIDTMTRVVHDIQNKPEPISIESNQQCFNKT